MTAVNLHARRFFSRVTNGSLQEARENDRKIVRGQWVAVSISEKSLRPVCFSFHIFDRIFLVHPINIRHAYNRTDFASDTQLLHRQPSSSNGMLIE